MKFKNHLTQERNSTLLHLSVGMINTKSQWSIQRSSRWAINCERKAVDLIVLFEVTSKWRVDLATLLSGTFKVAVLQVSCLLSNYGALGQHWVHKMSINELIFHKLWRATKSTSTWSGGRERQRGARSAWKSTQNLTSIRIKDGNCNFWSSFRISF